MSLSPISALSERAKLMVPQVLRYDDLHLGDAGHYFCGAHAGASTRYTGRDISGGRVHVVTTADHKEARRLGIKLVCDRCSGAEVLPAEMAD